MLAFSKRSLDFSVNSPTRPCWELVQKAQRTQRQNLTSRCPATARVLNISELVEQILLDTTTFEIQVAANVCPFFRAVIENSSPLKAQFDNSGMKDLGALSQKPDVWHSCLSTLDGCKTLFILRIPSEEFTTFLLSDHDLPYLWVLDGDCSARFNRIYMGRLNVELWEDRDKGIREVLCTSWRDREMCFQRYISKFY